MRLVTACGDRNANDTLALNLPLNAAINHKLNGGESFQCRAERQQSFQHFSPDFRGKPHINGNQPAKSQFKSKDFGRYR
jgi:hypothetical protein